MRLLSQRWQVQCGFQWVIAPTPYRVKARSRPINFVDTITEAFHNRYRTGGATQPNWNGKLIAPRSATSHNMHNAYCFASQTAPCLGYFANDTLPCVCSSRESLLLALSQVAFPFVPVDAMVTPVTHSLPLSA